MGLVELGQHSGLSAAMLSKIERGRLVPTLPTLLRIALVFSVGLDHFFGDPARPLAFAIVRKKDRQRFPERQGDTQPAYWFESLDFPAVDRRMSAYFVEFEEVAADRIKRHHHSGAESSMCSGAGSCSRSTTPSINSPPATRSTSTPRLLTPTGARGGTVARRWWW